jgi:putative DNA primase/helicase
MSVLEHKIALAANLLLQGLPAFAVEFSPNGSPAWQNEMIALLLATDPSERIKALREYLKGRTDLPQIDAEIMSADLPPIPETKLHLTDTGNAEMLASRFGDQIRFDRRRSRWLVWYKHRWLPDEDGTVQRMVLEAVRERMKLTAEINDPKERKEAYKFLMGSESSYRIRSTMDCASWLYPISDKGDGWDKDPMLLCCNNGIVDLKTGELRRGYPGDRITMCTGLDYNPSSSCSRWEQFLNEIFCGDLEMVNFIQRACGYSITGSVKEQCLFLAWGGGANGKSTFLNSLRQSLGDYARNTPFSTFEQTRHDTGTNDLAALSTTRFITASETSEASKLNEARVKAITGGDPVTARFLFAEYFSYYPIYKIWLAMNHLPSITGTDDGIWRRIRLIPFTENFKGREDLDLGQKLAEEKEGILAWIVRGCLDWQKIGLQAPEKIHKATDDYRVSSDELAQFLGDCTQPNDRAKIKSGDLYREYVTWCNSFDYKPIHQQAFGRRMTDHGIKSERKSGNYWYIGIGLKVKEQFMREMD